MTRAAGERFFSCHIEHPLAAVARPLYVRASDVPSLFTVSRSSIYGAAGRGELRIYKPTGTALLKVAEVEGWIEARTEGVGTRVGQRRSDVANLLKLN